MASENRDATLRRWITWHWLQGRHGSIYKCRSMAHILNDSTGKTMCGKEPKLSPQLATDEVRCAICKLHEHGANG